MSVRALHPVRPGPGLLRGPAAAPFDRGSFRTAYLVSVLALATTLSASGGLHDPAVALTAWLMAAVAVPIGGVVWAELRGAAGRRVAVGTCVVLAAFLAPGAVAEAVARFGAGGAWVLLGVVLSAAWPALPRRGAEVVP